MDYVFIDINTMSTQTGSGSTSRGPIYRSNKTVWAFYCVKTNDWYKIQMLVLHNNIETI